MRDLRQLNDHLEITELLYRYGRAIDARDFDLLATCFTPDAAIRYNVGGGVALPFSQMAEWLRRALQIFRSTQHAMSSPLIELDVDEARASTYVTAAHLQVRLDGTEAYTIQHAVYRDQLARGAEGWRIRERQLDDMLVHGRFLGPDEVRKFERPTAG